MVIQMPVQAKVAAFPVIINGNVKNGNTVYTEKQPALTDIFGLFTERYALLVPPGALLCRNDAAV